MNHNILKVDEYPLISRSSLDVISHDLIFVLEDILYFISKSLYLCSRITCTDNKEVCKSGLLGNIDNLDIRTFLGLKYAYDLAR